MTYEELLAKIGNPIDEGYEYGDIVYNKALRAVVELHKPMEFQFNDNPVMVCGHCQIGVVGDKYSCETIQAIEKELA
jgi:hypothetical protein